MTIIKNLFSIFGAPDFRLSGTQEFACLF